MIKVYTINLNSNFNHVKVLRCTKTVPHSSTEPDSCYFPPSSVWCLDAETQEKTSHRCCYWPLLILLFLILLLLFYTFFFFEVLHSGQHSSPLLKHRLMLLLHFKMESTGTNTPNSTLIPSERNMQRSPPSAGFANGTNLELWFHERILSNC